MKTQMTKQELIEKYGKVKLYFTNYYNNRFSFVGQSDGETVSASTEGNFPNIFTFEVIAGRPETIESINADHIKVIRNGEIIAEYQR